VPDALRRAQGREIGMANDYYNYSNDFVPGQKVQSLNLDQEFAAIAAAFDKLGDPTTILNGAGVGGTESGTADNYVVDNGGVHPGRSADDDLHPDQHQHRGRGGGAQWRLEQGHQAQ
ncbi:MAG: hypothetical protein KDK71_09985, partial [Chlamydiia bacterium]|nr:hypothetical protein [Chlamydiia bacterium]